MSIDARFLFSLLVASLMFAAPSYADQILYQTSFDTDTTDVPGTYSPISFDPVGYSRPYLPVPGAADAIAVVENGVAHIRRTGTGSGSSLGFAAPELTIRSSDIGAGSAFPDIFSLSFEAGGTSGNNNWWGVEVRINDRVHDPILYGFWLGPCASCWSFSINGLFPDHTSASGAFVAAANVLYPIDMTITKLVDAYQFDVSVTNPSTSTTYTDSKVVNYSHDLSAFTFARQGHGGGDALFDNFSVTTPIPEPSTALLLGVGLAGLGMRRRTRRGC